MKFTADITPVTTRPMGLPLLTFEVEGTTAYTAARMAAFKAARRLYPNVGEPSFMRQRKDGSFQASIGVSRFENGYQVNNGITIIIRLSPA